TSSRLAKRIEAPRCCRMRRPSISVQRTLNSRWQSGHRRRQKPPRSRGSVIVSTPTPQRLSPSTWHGKRLLLRGPERVEEADQFVEVGSGPTDAGRRLATFGPEEDEGHLAQSRKPPQLLGAGPGPSLQLRVEDHRVGKENLGPSHRLLAPAGKREGVALAEGGHPVAAVRARHAGDEEAARVVGPRRVGGKGEREDRAPAGPLRGPDIAAVQLHQLPADGQPEADALPGRPLAVAL